MSNRNLSLLPAFAAVLFVMSCSSQRSATDEAVPPGKSYQSFTEDGAWCWFSDPRAVYFEGDHKRTYSGWVDSTGNIVVAFYDHETGAVQKHVLHEHFEKDDHDNPSFFVDAQGKLMVFYSKHGTGRSPIHLARASNPEDISAWEPVQLLALNDTVTYAGLRDSYTYTNPVQLSDEGNRMYLFWRGADFKPNYSFSDDGGRNWEQGGILILPERIYKNRRPYLKVASNNKDVIHFAFTDGHPHVEPTNSIYYARYRDGAFYKANGDKIKDWSALPLDPEESDVVYDASASKEKAWIWDVAENDDGNPVVVYAKFPSDSNHVYYCSIFDEGRWNEYRLTEAGGWFPHTPEGRKEREPNYSGGIVLDHKDPSQVYLSREKNGVFEIEHWSTNDKGKNWKSRDVTRNSGKDNVRPFVVRGYPGDASIVLWMNLEEYVHYTDYRGAIKMAGPHSK